MVTKETLQKILKQNILELNFQKKNGEERNMLCTLQKQFLPESSESNPDKPIKKENSGVLAVWDLEKDGFRSFRIESVKDYQIVTEGYEL